MKCPKCGHNFPRYYSEMKDGKVVATRYVCQGPDCGHKWRVAK